MAGYGMQGKWSVETDGTTYKAQLANVDSTMVATLSSDRALTVAHSS